MQDANHLRDLARHCRALSKTVIEPEVVEQLRVWAVDFADEADQVERHVEDDGGANGRVIWRWPDC
jgi:hypothetical protein